jgi:four helix bundle protein
MKNHRNLSVLEAAEAVETEINGLIDDSSQRLIHTTQLRRSAHSIVANISEAFGRGADGGRAQSLRVARGEAEETISSLAGQPRIETHRSTDLLAPPQSPHHDRQDAARARARLAAVSNRCSGVSAVRAVCQPRRSEVRALT